MAITTRDFYGDAANAVSPIECDIIKDVMIKGEHVQPGTRVLLSKGDAQYLIGSGFAVKVIAPEQEKSDDTPTTIAKTGRQSGNSGRPARRGK